MKTTPDQDLLEKYHLKRNIEIRSNQLLISLGRLMYLFYILYEVFSEEISYQRPIMYLVSILVNMALILITDRHGHLNFLHAPSAIVSFATFTLNDPGLYRGSTDHVALMVGYISMCYLAATFLSRKWEVTSIVQVLST